MQKTLALSKTLWAKLCALFCMSLLTLGGLHAQCNLLTLKHITYDTLIVGNANDEYSINLPQFNPSIGTLVSVNLNSTISLNYGFTLQNVETVQRDFTVQVSRYDQFTSNALNDMYSNEVDTSVGEFLLNPNDVISKNPYTVLHCYSENDSITNSIAPFLGNHSISFDYLTATSTNLSGSTQYAFNANANDTVRFSITYYYCETTVLANDPISFFAEKGNDNIVKLSWLTTGNQQGMNYELQSGFDEKQFSAIDSVQGASNVDEYSYDYKIADTAKNKIYFRLKIINGYGQIKYSDIKEIDLSQINNAAKSFVYPNPANDYINIQLASGNWDIRIYSALGILMQQNQFSNTSSVHLSFNGKLTPGTYFIKAQSIDSKQQQAFQFIVQ